MSKDPAFLFYPNDFDMGTKFFTDEQAGKYIRLLIAQHQHGHLTEKQVNFICKSYDKDVFSKFIRDSEGLYYNERLDIEINKRRKYSESRSKNKTGKKTYDQHMENENKDENINTSFCLNINETKLRISEMPSWKELIQRTYKLSEEQVEKYISNFFNEVELKGYGNTVRSIPQTQSYFINWLKIQLEKKPNLKDQPITTSHKRVTREEQIRINEEYLAKINGTKKEA